MNQSPSRARRRLTLLLILLLFAGAAGAAVWWYLQVGQWHESTDNAYLAGNLVTVSSEVSGIVVRVGAEENDAVRAGEELAVLAEGDALAALEVRKQHLALAVQEVHARRAIVQRARAELALREITHQLAREEYERRKRLSARRVLADEELDAARTRAEETAGELETARHALLESQVRAGTGAIEAHPLVSTAAANLRSAWRDWRKTRIPSPVTGRIARRRVQLGQRVAPGTPLYSIVEQDAVWVEANFKEDQLRNIRTGQSVELRSDLYRDEWPLHGRVEGIGNGTGSVFSVLPAQNATGNWIKIVQRVPVRIALDPPPDEAHPLPLGASLHVSVDTHERGGSRLPARRPADARPDSTVYDLPADEADQLVAGLIAAATAASTPP